MVRRLSPRWPDPICCRRFSARSLCAPDSSRSRSRDLRTAKANCLLRNCDRSFWQRTVNPVGRCFRITHVSTFWTFWPPLPALRVVVHSKSFGGISKSIDSGSGKTATVIVEVWTRPLRSVGGIRCHRWPPASFANAVAAPGPSIERLTYPGSCSMRSTLKPPPHAAAGINLQLVFDEQLGVIATFGRSDFDDRHGSSVDE